jgi:hypothetical protein
MATHTPDGRELTFTGPPCAVCEEMIIGAVINACGKQYHEAWCVRASHAHTPSHMSHRVRAVSRVRPVSRRSPMASFSSTRALPSARR